ncbi:AAA family ATPase [Robbsia sp. Bb-Pol-6]|uniref:AAA family ATPase n=1 Tax=Robbsia betulipollinis TaxID=2981849 RepID=A0ABT3ZTI7_9BURK|nr:AAA family ATPase [Robbsia betulipollinis]MCY0389894.1 AAA family ATPase [Robbsia betulipollinis]
MATRELPPLRETVSMEALSAIADKAAYILGKLRDDLLEPWPRKQPPRITAARLASICGLEKSQINYLCTRGNKDGTFPTGTMVGATRRREFTLGEAQAFVRALPTFKKRPAGQDGLILGVGNFKGGVGKTTTSVAIAQGMTLRGHKVLLVDLDPQASSSVLMGYLPDAEITEEMTVMPAVYGETDDLSAQCIPSYWTGLDILPACPALFGADYALPSQQSRDPSFEYWRILEQSFKPLKKTYDLIIIDTPPSLSYLATASFMSTDGLIVPLPPESLDYASCAQFFGHFSDLFKSLGESRDVAKEFEFIRIVLSKVKSQSATTDVVKTWIKQTYSEILANGEMLESDVVKNSAAEFKTLYDLQGYDGSVRTYNRALEAFDAVVAEIENEVQQSWRRRVDSGEHHL